MSDLLRELRFNLVGLFGDGAYLEAIARARHDDSAGGDPRHWLAVRREIARRIGQGHFARHHWQEGPADIPKGPAEPFASYQLWRVGDIVLMFSLSRVR